MGVLVLLTPIPVLAQEDRQISEITLEGTLTVEPGMILSAISSRVGDPLDPKQVTKDIKALNALGYFDSVTIESEPTGPNRVKLIIRLTEKPRIGTLIVKGITLLDKDAQKKAITLKPGGVYNPSEVQDVIEKITEAYKKAGYLRVMVTSETKEISQNQIAVLILVKEFPHIFITNIRVKNNHLFSTPEIKRFMETSEVDAFTWMSGGGLNERKVNADLQHIAMEYLKRGYIRVYIRKPKVMMYHNPEYSRVDIDLDIEEGLAYTTGKVDIDGDILGEKEELMELVTLHQGDPFNPFKQNQDIQTLRSLYTSQGYAFAKVIPQTQVDDETRVVSITYRLVKGEKAYIRRIEIQGNKETRDYVIRREFTIHEQELFSGGKLQESIGNIQRLGYFKSGSGVGASTQATDVNNEFDVAVKLEETQTGNFQAQLGYGERDGLTMALGLSKGNLFGRGQTIRLRVETGQHGVTRNYSFDFEEPHLFGSDLTYESNLSLQSIVDYTESNRGLFYQTRVMQGMGYRFFKLWIHSFNIEAINRTFLNSMYSDELLRTFSMGLTYNSVNNPIFPSSGTKASWTASQTGGAILAGTHEYRTYRFLWQQFHALNEDATLVWMAKLNLAMIETIGNNPIPEQERFRIGGITTLRGYDYAEIGGPFGLHRQRMNSLGSVDTRTLGMTPSEIAQLKGGGTMMRLFTMEMLFPLTGENLRGVVFYDAGNVNAESYQYALLKEKQPAFFDVYQSTGFGVRMITPMGVFRFEYGVKLNPEKGDTPGKLDFTISSLF
ncbi:MAG: outer membrane protein assembly factor BamA [Deltaproteobacteria bacterium]|nr:outer membrane protein assembly factor BamA [Deltaproteobacteria bacterium]